MHGSRARYSRARIVSCNMYVMPSLPHLRRRDGCGVLIGKHPQDRGLASIVQPKHQQSGLRVMIAHAQHPPHRKRHAMHVGAKLAACRTSPDLLFTILRSMPRRPCIIHAKTAGL